jgi:proteasome component ECM29
VEELLEQLGSHLWRNRQSSAAALADLIRGRKWIELKNYFEGIWEGVFRVVDDIKETVRIAGMTLASSLQKTTARLCEGMIKEEKSPAAIVFPILLEKGIPSAVEEVKSLSLSVLYHLVKYSDKRLLGQYLPKIAGSLLECLSSLESSSMNYIEQHAERVGIDKERLENLRVKAANASIVGDMLDRITACVNSENLSDLCIKLSDLLKNGFGINTRAGAARFLSAITLRMRYDMKPVCSRMLKALISPLGNDSNLAICKAYASTFAQMSKFSEQKYVDARVDKLLEAIQDEDSTMQRAGAIFVLELCRQAPDVFSTYKQNILPIAFYMKHNTEEKVAKLWDSVWDEGAPSDSAAVRMYHIDIGNLCLSALKSDKYNTRRSGSVGIKDLVEKSNGFLLTNALELCAALVSMLPGRYWEGKESVLETLGLLCSKNSTNIPGIDEVLTSLSEPLKRKKTVMIVAAVNSIALVIEGVSSVKDSTLVEIIKLLVQNCSVEEEEEKEEGQTPNLEKTISSLNCLSKCWIAVQDKAIVGEEVFNLLIKMSDSSKESSWRVRNAAISAAKDILDSETALQALESHNKWLNPLGDSVLNTFCIEKREKSMSLLISLIGVLVERKYSKFMLEDLLGKIKASVSSKLDEISSALLAQAKRIVEEI